MKQPIRTQETDMTTMEIPQMWLAGRTLARELEGMAPGDALKQAVADWSEQERLAAQYDAMLIKDLSRNAVIARIRTALKTRSGKAWSVTGGRGTAYGWITVEAPPARRTWSTREVAGGDPCRPTYEEYDTYAPNHHTSPAERAELAALLGVETVHHQGMSIPSGHDYYREYIDRAEGRPPRVIAQPYWD